MNRRVRKRYIRSSSVILGRVDVLGIVEILEDVKAEWFP